jgi:hypothetical protein
MRILVLIDSLGAVEYHRLAMPFAYIKEFLKVDFAIHEKEINQVDFTNYDTVVISRYLTNMDLVYKIKALGIRLIVDVDDYWNVPRYNPAYKIYNEKAKKSVLECLKLADMVWVTTHQLKDTVFPINSNVHILPNYIDSDEPQWNAISEHPLTIGYVGGFTHLEDLKLLNGQMEEICKRNNARFLMCGYKHLDPLYLEMEYQITGSRKHRPDWFYVSEMTTILKYGIYYSMMDVAIAPLTKTHFNKHKSELKIVEASTYKLPIVCSEVEPYTNHIDNKGVLFAKGNDWGIIDEAIKRRKELGELNYLYCKEHHNIDTINATRIELLNETTH